MGLIRKVNSFINEIKLDSLIDKLSEKDSEFNEYINKLMESKSWSPRGCPRSELTDYIDYEFKKNSSAYPRPGRCDRYLEKDPGIG